MKLCFPEKVLNQHLIVLGKTGAGKSSALRHIVEHLLDHQKRVCVIDIKGDWWGLKLSADGKSAGYPVIAFGSFREPKATDVPINRHSGPDVAELIASGNRPCIIGFRGWMPSEITEFWIGTEPAWRGFASTLFNKNEGELYVVISECHNFAPKGKVLDPKAGRVLHWTNRLLSEGRGLGMTFLLDSQRPQKVHNDTLTSCETLVAMRVTHAADRGAVKDWIDGCGDKATGTEVLNTVAQMARGEAWVWSPEIGFGPERIQFPMFTTFDSFAPAQLQKKVSGKGWSTVDLEAVKSKLASVIEEAKGNDPAELKARIRELTTQLAQAKKAQPKTAAAVKGIDQATLKRAVEEAVRKTMDVRDEQWMRATEKYTAGLERVVNEQLKRLDGALHTVKFDVPPKIRKIDTTVELKKVASQTQTGVDVQAAALEQPRRGFGAAESAAKAQSNGDLSNPQMKILASLAEAEAIGRRMVKRSFLAALSGSTAASSGFRNNLSVLRTSGLIDYPQGDFVSFTAQGREKAPEVDAPSSPEEMVMRCKELGSQPQASILEELKKVYPDPLSREELAERVGSTAASSGFRNNLSVLRTREMIGYPSGSQVKLASWVMLEEE